MRGARTLFTNIFEETPAPTADPSAKKKGRNAALHAARTEALVYRYYWYASGAERNYPRIIEKLSAEFWLSEATIPELLSEHHATLQRLRREQPQPADLRKKFPHLVW